MGTQQVWWVDYLDLRESSFGSSFAPIYLCDLGKAILGYFFIIIKKKTLSLHFFNLKIYGIILSLGVLLTHKNNYLTIFILFKNVLMSASWRG